MASGYRNGTGCKLVPNRLLDTFALHAMQIIPNFQSPGDSQARIKVHSGRCTRISAAMDAIHP